MTSPTERLDLETEQRIESVIEFAVVHGAAKGKPVEGCEGCAKVRDALRSRIRTLIEEARKEGADAMWLECDTRGIPHD